MLVAYKNRMNNKASKVAQSNLSLNKINSMYFPFPPLEEQERIVERVNAIMAQIDEYEKIEQELVQLKANLPGDMRAAILQAAMQGKLTKQLESDSSVDEMIKQKICNSNSFIPVDEEEHPFDIPTNWQWVRLGNFVSFVGGTSYKRTDTTDKGVRILRGGNIQEYKILYYEDDVFLPNKFKDEGKTIKNGDILIVASTGSKTVIGKPGFVYFDDKDTQIGAFLRIIRIKEEFTETI